MRRDAAAAGAELGEQMSQLVAQGAVDLRRVVLAQARIQRDEFAAIIRAPGGAEKPRVPFHLHRGREFRRVQRLQHFAGFRFEVGIAPEHDERGRRRENEIELAVAELVVRLQGAAV